MSISLSPRDLWSGLWNSWCKPLLMIVLSGLVCIGLELAEPVAIALTLVAFLVALLWCRALPEDCIDIREER